jgi:uncharacterized protein (DUF427 family)
MRDLMMERLGDLRYEPTEKWLRGSLDGVDVVDSTGALLVWEPRRIVPSYAVPVSDIAGTLTPVPSLPAPDAPVLTPGNPFAAHSTPGQAYDVVVGDRTLPGAAFTPQTLEGYVVLDFRAFDRWREEADEQVGHPRDPYHRVDMRPSDRRVQISRDGVLLADSTRPTLVFETSLMTRFYLPREDVLADLQPTATKTTCAYKGHASYYAVNGVADLAWTYLAPVPDAQQLTGLVAFYDERVDVVVDGVVRGRPSGPIAEAIRTEFGLDQ